MGLIGVILLLLATWAVASLALAVLLMRLFRSFAGPARSPDIRAYRTERRGAGRRVGLPDPRPHPIERRSGDDRRSGFAATI